MAFPLCDLLKSFHEVALLTVAGLQFCGSNRSMRLSFKKSSEIGRLKLKILFNVNKQSNKAYPKLKEKF